MRKLNNIMASVILIFIPLVYLYGVYQWKANEFSGVQDEIMKGKHLYFVSFSSAFYAFSIACFLLANNNWVKLVTSAVSSFCAVLLYQEVRYGDKQWTEWSYWNIMVVSLNYFLFYCIIEKYKKHIKNARDNRIVGTDNIV